MQRRVSLPLLLLFSLSQLLLSTLCGTCLCCYRSFVGCLNKSLCIMLAVLQMYQAVEVGIEINRSGCGDYLNVCMSVE